MTLQQLEAFLARAQEDPALQAPLASAPDAEAIAAIASDAGFAVSVEDLLAAVGETPATLAGIERLAEGVVPVQEELEAFLQQVEADADLQTALASASDPEAVAAIARLAGFQLSAEDLWEASHEAPAALESGSFDELADLLESGAAGEVEDRESLAALASFLRHLEHDPALQAAVAAAADAAAVASIAREAGHAVREEVLWQASAETPQSLVSAAALEAAVFATEEESANEAPFSRS